MRLCVTLLSVIVALLGFSTAVHSMEHKSLRQSKAELFTKVGLFIEGFTPESIARTRMAITKGFEQAEIIDLTLDNLKALPTTHDIQLFVAPSEARAGLESAVKEGMAIISGFVQKGSFLFSQMDSSSTLCREFDYEGTKSFNTPFIYDGVCVGPITKSGPMETECRAIKAHVDSRTRMVTYNNLFVHRGFYFVDAESKKNCKILASATPRDNSRTLIEFRSNTNAKAIIVACRHGSGAAILSGVQLDQNAAFLSSYIAKHPENTHVKEVAESLSDVSELSASLLHFVAMMKVTATLE
ncbi:Biotin-protein ligase, N terminal family protein [Cryptosporidium meleagridis]|uniref:Biotin-protein ligase, N terminal family protein n=1 Tax=Cryptosporidium meleagridis TaxID=93969 RepID=A0A2P4Z579_9CRYT|nr:Biotin-protein ligase, N terminal family protein [Cryptosporidium meleagridis]